MRTGPTNARGFTGANVATVSMGGVHNRPLRRGMGDGMDHSLYDPTLLHLLPSSVPLIQRAVLPVRHRSDLS